ncbi:MAG: response regulator transcription factor [Armatimonadota bacterium]
MSLTILLADDHEVVRYGMCLLLDGEDDLEVVGEAGCAAEVLSLGEQLRPDLIMLDLCMPGVTGTSLIVALRERYPQLLILVLSMYKDQDHVLSALRAGASGYVLKENQAEEIVRAIRQVAAGKKYLSPVIADLVIEDYVSGKRGDAAGRLEDLTPRELEIIQKAAEGLTSAEIGKQLFISARTVETHRSRAMQKLGLQNLVELVRLFVSRELQEPDR